MDKKTLKALKGSIKKWEKIVEGEGEDLEAENCPLCHLFYNNLLGKVLCVMCPIYIKGGLYCKYTPYVAWKKHQLNKHPRKKKIIHCKICEKLAKKELKFLRSLLPRGEKV